MEYVTLTIAIIALVQPWGIALWRRFFRQGEVDIHKTGLIEVGFSGFGPTLGLHGTLRALHRDMFVSEITLAVVRLRDNARHDFNWTVFREGSAGQEVMSVPASFLVSSAQPQRYNILFSDNATRQEIQEDLAPVVEAWQALVLENFPVEDEDPSHLYEDFSGTEVHVEAYSEIRRHCYWEAGQYSLEMRISTSRPNRVFEDAWTFELTDQDAELLRRNTIAILRHTAWISDIRFNFAYSPYVDAQ